MRALTALTALLLFLGACTEERPSVRIAPAPELPDETAEIQEPPGDREGGPAARAARRIARDIMDRYALVEVWRAEAVQRGQVVIYAVRFRLEERSEHPEFDDWYAHVRLAAREQREAAVTMLQRTVTDVPRARLVSVYQDDHLRPFWSRTQIETMDKPMRYRRFDAWQELVLSAELLPGRPG